MNDKNKVKFGFAVLTLVLYYCNVVVDNPVGRIFIALLILAVGICLGGYTVEIDYREDSKDLSDVDGNSEETF